jgi:hypothetical protein
MRRVAMIWIHKLTDLGKNRNVTSIPIMEFNIRNVKYADEPDGANTSGFRIYHGRWA